MKKNINTMIKNIKSGTPEARQAVGVLCGVVGIFLNILLFIGKYVTGKLTASVAITADAFNNLSDAGSSLITLLGFRLAGKKPDPDHPFGHGRMEYITGLAVSAIIFLVGFELAKESIQKIISPEETELSYIAVAVLIISCVVKLIMFAYNKIASKMISSGTLAAAATDSVSDSAATAIVLIATLLGGTFGVPLDGFAGLAVSIFIAIAGIRSCLDTLSPLLGAPPEKEFTDEIKRIVTAHDMVIGIHDLVVHDYGPGRRMISLHAEVDGSGDIYEIHEEIDIIEKELANKLGAEAVIHMDPIATNDPETEFLRRGIADVLKKALSDEVSIHDFRIVKGPTHINAIFDIVIPYGISMEDKKIRETVDAAVHAKYENITPVINIDRPYV